MPTSRAVELARRAFLAHGSCAVGAGCVPAAVLASWERCRDLDTEHLAPVFAGHPRGGVDAAACAADVFDGFLGGDKEMPHSLLLVDPAARVRVRRDGDPTLAGLLDDVRLVPGHDWSEQAVGTTAAGLALHEQADAVVTGPEHLHDRLAWLAEAASLVVDPRDHTVAGVVVLACHVDDRSSLQLPLARDLARQVAERLAGEPHRRSVALLDAFRQAGEKGDDPVEWVLATDGTTVLTDDGARRLDDADLRTLSDRIVAELSVREFTDGHVELPSGTCADVTVAPVRLGPELVGCVLRGRRATAGELADPTAAEARRRQGSHVAPVGRRDYAADLRRHAGEHDEARVRANRELLTPFVRARLEVTAGVRQGRNHILVGEQGVGKRTLVTGQFRRAAPDGRVVTVDCASFAVRAPTDRDPLEEAAAPAGERRRLLLLHGLEHLTPVGARRLDECLRPLVAARSAPLVAGTVGTAAIDATRPYGLLLRHFHETVRVPALRHRVDEIGEIALAVLARLAPRRSLRLSLQAVRVLEGYAWPGNISELEDVLRYVLARKPLGEIRPPDLPALCFQGRVRKLSMLEAAQCDAIIQALYEARGNRYQAAALLGIARSSLYRKIDAFGISYIA